MPSHDRRRVGLRHAAIATLGAAVLSCSSPPVHSLLENFKVRVTDTFHADEPIRLDFLWVIDNSSSMGAEQRDLAKGFGAFVAELQALGPIDAQMAVVTVQQTPDKNDLKVVGRFRHHPATQMPTSAAERVLYPCTTDADCATTQNHTFAKASNSSLCAQTTVQFTPKFPGISWSCNGPSNSTNLANFNCSLNSTCTPRCKSDADCRALYEPQVAAELQTIQCVPQGSASVCLFPPASAGCPSAEQLPPVLTSQQLDLFRCNASVGAAQTAEAGFEGGFRSAWEALDPDGPNCSYDACVAHLRSCCTDGGAWCSNDKDQAQCATDTAAQCECLKDAKNCQHQALVREGAYLVIVFVSDDDDCSVDPGLNPLDKSVISKEVWGSCQRQGDQLAGNHALNEANCEFKRGKDASVYCPSDCSPGSTTKDPAGVPKCGNGCIAGSAEQQACTAKVEAGFTAMLRSHAAIPQVGHWVNLFKSLKPDPAHVIVAAITGDTVSTVDPAQAFRDRVDFYHSVFKNVAPKQVPYVCAGERGSAGFGSRYVELAQSFGGNGVVENICEGEDFSAALGGIATTILKRVVKICLPQPPEMVDGKPQILVTRTRNGTSSELAFVEAAQSSGAQGYFIAASPDCRSGKSDLPGQLAACSKTADCSAGLTCSAGLCQVYSDAIFFTEVPDPSDVVEISYTAGLAL
ncbi:MAG: hypothetical protein H6747_04660 [Deltaproteobacteria bacterium]|nr:hypothetical protein [Deltaproteobacteria bacterium]